MDTVSQFQSGIPEQIEYFFYECFGVVAGDIPIHDHQIDIRVDAELLPPVRA